ncbi:condensation domain-containing protein [Enhygromyxa salina]|uniref:Linear gramicidin synthase subunit B n=1 Tax=Enhygromyxa salina TaxID=215803 RepID=A0A2S9YN02_9BACT|nr:condensation domain-containing protein [Enhygromyxa salina]PRQ06476.1 Linear gramicidin synthase subunit B [Enhygromyxa salina]
MTLTELLLELGRRGVTVQLDAGELKVSAPRGVLTGELLAALREHKPALIERLGGGRASVVEVTSRDRPIPLSAAQERMWFLKQLETELGRFNVPIAARLRGPFDRQAFAASLDLLVARHEILRTRYELRGSAAVQVIDAQADSPLVVIDGRELGETERAAAIEALITTPAGPGRGAIEVRLLELDDEHHAIAVSLRDVALDGWSRGVFVTELGRLYAALSGSGDGGRDVDSVIAQLPRLPIQYADWCAWQQRWLAGPEAAAQLSWWTQTLAGLPRDAGLRPDHPRPRVRRMQARLHPITFAPELVAALRSWTSASGATLYAALLASFAVVASRRSEAAEIVVGAPVANREQRETASVLGLFANNVVLRLHPTPSAEPTALLLAIRTTIQEAVRRQAIPFEVVVNALDTAHEHDRTPLFQVIVALNVATPDAALGGATLEPLVVDEQLSRFDLELAVEESRGQLSGYIKYDVQLYEPATIAAVAHDLVAVTEQLTSAPTVAAIHCPAIAELPPPRSNAAASPAARVIPHPNAPKLRASGTEGRAPESELERRVAALFAELLAVEVESATADFFALGGHSLAATRLALEVRRRFAVELPVHCVFEHSSVAELAAWIEARGESPTAADCMVLLRHSPGGQPVFVLPPGIGSPACYSDMHWPDGVTVWGAQIPGLFEAADKPDFDAIIRGWAAAIRELQPDGPHSIVGWSLGAQLGPELAAELEGRGSVVNFLCLIDGGPLPGDDAPGWRPLARAPGRPTDAIRIWAAVRMPERDELARWLAWCGLALPPAAGPRPSFASLRSFATQTGRTIAVFTRNVMAAARVRARSCQAPILLIRAEEHRGRPDALLGRVRARTAGSVETIYAAGNHMSMMLEPEHRRALSQIIATAWSRRASVDGAERLHDSTQSSKARTGT